MKPRAKHKIVTLACAVLTLFALTFPSALRASLVLNTNDSGPGSLRDLIAIAPAGDTITFDPSLSGQTITLTNGQITITNDVTLDASALSGGITVSGNNTSRVFDVSSNSITTFSSLRVTQGRATSADPSGRSGGGIFNAGTLTLTNCYLWGNHAGINGGAIYNVTGSVTLHHSTITTNFADDFGAGICNVGGNIVINHSILSSNRIGAVAGGAIYVTNGSVTMNDSTVFANTARFGGGIAAHYFGDLSITNCTFYKNFTSSGACIDS